MSTVTRRSAVALIHVAFEDLDALAPILEREGFDSSTIEVPCAGDWQSEAESADLLVVLGGPIGVYQQAAYPWLAAEISLVGRRLRSGRPTIGICLGAQIMAASLGSEVRPGSRGKEIGWAPVRLTEAGSRSPLGVLANGSPVLHWHGDTFDLPPGAERLASTVRYENQAFSFGRHGLALQFHLEVSAAGLERWLVGHTGELAAEGIDVSLLRDRTRICAPLSNEALDAVVTRFNANI